MDKALQTMIDNMAAKTGKSLDEWKALLKKKSFSKHSEAINFLKNEHTVTHGFANTIVALSKEESHIPIDLVDNQYKGKEFIFFWKLEYFSLLFYFPRVRKKILNMLV